jgi:membrane protein DedA with SNARE-associated domain
MEPQPLLASLQHLLATQGYAFLALGLVLEGETVVLLAGFAAHQGWMRLPLVVALAAGVTWLLDQSLFWVGRWKGEAVLSRWPRMAASVEKAHRLIERYPHASVLGVRFAYGMRTVGPIVIGASGLPAIQYAALAAVAATLWAGVFATLGWYFGAAAQRILAQAGYAQLGLLALIAAAVAAAAWRRRRRRRDEGEGSGRGE